MKLYISRIRTADGNWHWDEEARPLRETKKLAAQNRALLGLSTQVWPEDEARPIIERHAATTQPRVGRAGKKGKK